MKDFTLAAFSAEKRVAAVAIFNSTKLEDIQLRHVPPDISKAAGSVREIITRTLERYRPGFVAISCPSQKAGTRVRVLCDVAKSVASEFGIPSMEVDDSALRDAYGHPSLVRKEQVRRAGRTIWPSLAGATSKRAVLDAATVGLFVQAERLRSFYGEVE